MLRDNTPLLKNLAIFTIKGKEITGYVDLTTGEIISKAEYIKLGGRSIKADAMLRRTVKLNKLRKETRELANFLLSFRNQACGFLVSIETLIDWYCKLNNKRKNNVKTSLPYLVDVGILDEDYMLNKDFMINNVNRTSSQAKGDTFKAEVLFNTVLLKQS